MKRNLLAGLSFAVLVTSVVLYVLACNFAKSNKKSMCRKVDDTGACSSSAASAGSNSYDVFLSFSSKDTRKTFADRLYEGLINAGICMFTDNNELPEGEKIGTNFLQTIKNMLVASILLSVLAYVKSNKKSTHRKAEGTWASSSFATSASENYDVFLSFKGEDTRKTFVDHLYNGLVNAGIRVFRDDNELREGEMIGTNLLQAIKNSKISIPIISQNYASSKWCLQELIEMMECMKSIRHVVLPVFYRVKPAHVRYQIERFGKTFSHLSRKYLKEDVAKWKHALQEVASLKGWESERTADGHEGELVKMVVRKVLSELKKAELKKAFQPVITEHLVGIDNATEDILRLMDDKHDATQIIGIYGMGGIGKTTLAKAIYNKLFNQFQHHSFIADIRESSQSKGISYVQGQLKFDILKEKDHLFNQDEGIRIMESRYKRKKVLILLDDVDDIEHIRALVGKYDWFDMGSRIIITTRSRSVLDKAEVKCKYELEEMAEDESLVLFSRHAFRRDSPPYEFESLSHAIVSTTGGLPLSLEVIGSFLCGRDRVFWQDALKKLQIAPHEKVQGKLRISYDALNHEIIIYNQVTFNVPNVSGNVPMVDLIIAMEDVQLSGSEFVAVNATSPWANTNFGGAGTSPTTSMPGTVFHNSIGQMAFGSVYGGMIQQTLPTVMATPPVTANEKPEKFNGVGFKQWQHKMFFYLTMFNLTKYLSEVCPIISPNKQDVTTLDALEAWKHGDFLCRNYILNCLVNSLYNVYCNIESAKQLWESLEKKYKTEDVSTKKFVVAKFLDYKMVDSKSVMSQVQELQLIMSNISTERMILSESFQVAAMIEKLPPGWSDFKNYLKHKRKEMSLEDLILRLRIEEDNRSANPSSEPKANFVESSKSKQDRKRKMSFQGKGKQNEQFQKFQGTCFICNKPGHRAKDCKKHQKRRQERWCSPATELDRT